MITQHSKWGVISQSLGATKGISVSRQSGSWRKLVVVVRNKTALGGTSSHQGIPAKGVTSRELKSRNRKEVGRMETEGRKGKKVCTKEGVG